MVFNRRYVMSKNSLFPFIAGAALGAAAMWLAKADKEQVDAILDKVEKKLFKEKEPETDGTAE